MDDLKDYDDALIKFRKTLKYNTLPLLSWDLYAQSIDNLKASLKDMRTLMHLASTNKWNFDLKLIDNKFKKDKNVILVTDTKLNIVFASQNIWYMNQYHPEEIVGKQPKIFQGIDTTDASLKIIRTAVKAKKPFKTHILNYRKDGSIYNCEIQGQPVFDNTGSVINFIAFEKEVA